MTNSKLCCSPLKILRHLVLKWTLGKETYKMAELKYIKKYSTGRGLACVPRTVYQHMILKSCSRSEEGNLKKCRYRYNPWPVLWNRTNYGKKSGESFRSRWREDEQHFYLLNKRRKRDVKMGCENGNWLFKLYLYLMKNMLFSSKHDTIKCLHML